MKKIFTVLVLCMSLFALAACGSTSDEPDVSDEPIVLEDFWATLEESHDMPGMNEDSEEMNEVFFPGISEIETNQLIVKSPMMTATVCEYVFAECVDAENAEALAAILQTRIDEQAAGGAWYPESVEAWGEAQVIVNGNYVAMIASGEFTADDVAAFNALFE